MSWPRTSRHARGYGRAHEKIREQLLREVILCEECRRNGRTTAGKIADHIVRSPGAGRRNAAIINCSAGSVRR